MKNFFSLCLILFFCTNLISFADDDFSNIDLWQNFNANDYATPPEQKAVSDEQFDQTIEKVKKNKNKNFFGISKEPKKMKGESYQESNETEFITSLKAESPVLLIPCEIRTYDGGVLPVGHYQAEFVKDKEGFVTMKLYQAHYLIAQFPAEETTEDLFDEHLNYLTWDELEDNKIKVNYGSMDFNAFAILEKK